MSGPPPPVVFSFATWVAMFGEFAPLTPAQGDAYFMQASLLVANSTSNPIFRDGNLAALIYLATSHVAWLMCPKDANGNPAATGTTSPLVGRISQAAEGSVNVSTEWANTASMTDLEAYWIQTKYGAEYWAATAQYRTARYIANPASRRPLSGRVYGPGGLGWPWIT